MVNNFLISHVFSETAKVLDNKRLGKQRVETFQIINILDNKSKKKKRVGFVNHPAVKAWIGYTDALKLYCNTMLEEWERRGFKNNMSYYKVDPDSISYPKWIYNEKIHMSHKARLVQKDYTHYSPLFPEVINTEYMRRGYIWPSKWSLEQLETLPIEELSETLPLEERCILTATCSYKASVLTTEGWSCKIHSKGLTLVDNTCIATKKDGGVCNNKKKFGEYCGVHKR